MRSDIILKIEIPEGVTVTQDGSVITVKGPKGEISRTIRDKRVNITVAEAQVDLSALGATRRENARIFTYKAHILNMFKGVVEGHEYEVKICSGHFPMNVTYGNGQLVVKNFLGEKFPRTLAIREGVKVKVDGDIIRISSVDKELCGMAASDMEQLTRITNRDRRIFQDGLYIIKKDGRDVV